MTIALEIQHIQIVFLLRNDVLHGMFWEGSLVENTQRLQVQLHTTNAIREHLSCVIEAFSSQNFNRILNGGTLTLEFASSIFADDSSISKVAALIRYFISRGGHQLQLNAVNADMLKSAQKTPEEFRQLVVRIWGWSAYFIELDKEFQDHVISRQEYTV